MSIFVLPSLTSIFAEQNVALPMTTRIVIGFSHVMSNHPVLIIGGHYWFLRGNSGHLPHIPGQKSF